MAHISSAAIRRHVALDDAIGKLRIEGTHDQMCIGVRGVLYSTEHFDHPGGAYLVKVCAGTDATRLFESHHLNIRVAERALNRLAVIGTYEERDGADFRTFSRLREEALRALPTRRDREMSATTRVALTFYVCIGIGLHVAVLRCSELSWVWFATCVASSMMNAILGGFGHNACHRLKKEAVLLDWNGLSAYEWLYEHVQSHHPHVNTQVDIDAVSMSPFLNWIPSSRRALLPIQAMYIIFAMAELIQTLRGNFVHRLRWEPLCRGDASAPIWLRYAPALFWGRVASHAAFQEATIAMCSFLACMVMSGSYFAFLAHMSHANPDVGSSESHTTNYVTSQLTHTMDIQTPRALSHVALFLDRQRFHHMFPAVDHSQLPRLYSRMPHIARSLSIFVLHARMRATLKKWEEPHQTAT